MKTSLPRDYFTQTRHLDSFWRIKLNELRDRFLPGWRKFETAIHAADRDDDMPGIPDSPPSTARLPLPFIILSTALMTVLVTVLFMGSSAERGRLNQPEIAVLEAKLARAEAQLRDSAAQLRDSAAQREKLAAERQRLESELETARQTPPSTAPSLVVVVSESAPAAPTVKYTVRSGDTLYRIATLAGVSVDELVLLNRLASPDQLTAGQTILLPANADLTKLDRPARAFLAPQSGSVGSRYVQD